MAWDNSSRCTVGTVETSAAFNQRMTNLKRLRGVDTSQTDIDCQTKMAWVDYVLSLTTGTFDFRKRFRTSEGSLAEIAFLAENTDSPSAITTGDSVQIEQSIGILAGAEQDLALWAATRTAAGCGKLEISPIFTGASGTNGQVSTTILPGDSDGALVGVLTPTPAYELDLPSGTLNVSGDYRIGGAVLNDWTETLGAPNKLDWTGHATVTGKGKSTLATGTAPLSAASTTVCPRMDAEFLDGYGWHSGLFSVDSASYTATDDVITSVTLDRTGKWSVCAAVSVGTDYSDDGLTVNVKLDDSSTQIGQTAQFQAQKVVLGIAEFGATTSVFVIGGYTSAAGNEVVNVTVGVPTGTGSIATAALAAVWVGP